MGSSDEFKTLNKLAVGDVYKEKGSKFLGYAYPLSTQDEVDMILQAQKKEHPKARHWCYAWQLGVEKPVFRYNDDGEPNNSAGKPIYGQIQSFNVTNVMLVVVRYFGGTKLGVGGLVTAYKTAAKMAMENAVIVEKTLKENLFLQFEYAHLDKVMRVIKENDLGILSKKMELDCLFEVSVRKNKVIQVIDRLKDLRCVKIVEVT